MPQFDASTGQCLVRVYREGLAAAVGHDLAIEVGEFTVEVSAEAPRISARFSADSLRVLGTQQEYALFSEEEKKGNAAGVSTLSARDRSKIEGSIQDKVLQTRRFPRVEFESTAVLPLDSEDAVEVRGTLHLHGVARPISVRVEREAGMSVARVRLHQPDFEIAPFRALMGALKIKPDVDVELRLPLEVDALQA